MAGQPGFFDLDKRYAALSESGDPLERLARVGDFEIFRSQLDRALKRSERRRRPAVDGLRDDVQEILALRALWSLSDE